MMSGIDAVVPASAAVTPAAAVATKTEDEKYQTGPAPQNTYVLACHYTSRMVDHIIFISPLQHNDVSLVV